MADEIPASLSLLAKRAEASEKSMFFSQSESDGERVVSDKVYGIFMVAEAGGTFAVEALYGARRAAKLSSAAKGSGMSKRAAEEAMEKERSGRLRKGYSEAPSAAELARGAGEGAFPLTKAFAAKLPASVNDGFKRPGRAKCWGVSEARCARMMSECGGDLIFCDIAMVPTESVREAAQEAKGMVDAAFGEHGEEEGEDGGPMCVLAMWEGEPGGYSMLGTFVIGDDSICVDMVQSAAEKRGGFLIANSLDDNTPLSAFSELSWLIEQGVAGAEDAVEALMGWSEGLDEIRADADLAPMFARSDAKRLAKDLDESTPKGGRAKPKAPL